MGKKVLLSLAFVVVALTAFTQTESEHLKFKGVPIDGTLREYVSKMESAGFSYLGEDDGTALLEGEFAGVKGCTVGVSVLKSTNVVNLVGVLFPNQDNWASLENRYLLLKSMLMEKYGSPAHCVEEFQMYGVEKDDFMKLQALQLNRCTYYTVFSTARGDIELKINCLDGLDTYVSLKYFDKINTDAARAEAMDDL